MSVIAQRRSAAGNVSINEPWPWLPLQALAADEPGSITDGPFGSKLKTAHYTKSGPRVIRLTNVGDGVFIDAKAYISDAHFATLQRHRVSPGDLVIAALGENPPRSCIVPMDLGPAIVKADCIRFKPSSRVLAKFLNYVLNSDAVRSQTKAIVHGVGRPRLNLGEIKAITVPVPSVDEQRRIVAEIEKQFTRLDAGIAALRRTQANLKRYRAAILKAAAEGRLVPTEAELARNNNSDYETGEALLIRVASERRKGLSCRGSLNEPTAIDVSSLPGLPVGWTWASLDQLLSFMRNGISAKPDAEDGLPILRISAVRPLSVDLSEVRFLRTDSADYSDYTLAYGDLLFTRYNGNAEFVGVCGVVPRLVSAVVYPDKLIRCKLASKSLVPQFIAMVANVGESRGHLAKRVRTTAGQSGISGGDLKRLPIPLPPAAEQKRIATEVERRISIIEKSEAITRSNLQRSERLRQSILHRAFGSIPHPGKL